MADTEVGSLIVKIKGDVTDYKNKLSEMENTTTSSTSKSTQVLNKLENGLMTLTAGLATFAMASMKSAMEWGKAVNTFSNTTGLAGTEASKLLTIMKKSGVNADEASGMFAKFAKNIYSADEAMQKATASGEKSNDNLSKLGITARNNNGTFKTSYELFMEVKNKIGAMKDGIEKTNLEMELFGKSGTKMHEVLNMSSEEMQKVIDKAETMGTIIDTKTAKAWVNFDRSLKAVKGSLTANGIAIGNEMLPKLQQLVGSLQNVIGWYVALNKAQKDNINTMISFIAYSGTAVLALRAVGLAVGFAVNPWVALAVAIAGATMALANFLDQKNKVNSYDPKAEVYETQNEDGSISYQKKIQTKEMFMDDWKTGRQHEEVVESKVDLSPAELEEHLKYKANPEKYTTPEMQIPDIPSGGDIGGVGGADGGSAGTAQTQLQQYVETFSKLETLWDKQVQNGTISKEQQANLIKDEIEGLNKIAVNQDEVNDKELAVYDLKGKLLQVEKDKIELNQAEADRDYSAKKINEEEYYQKKLSNLQKTRDLAVSCSNEQLKIEKEIYDLQNEHAEKQYAIDNEHIDNLKEIAKDNLNIEAEQLRHQTALSNIKNKTGSTNATLTREFNNKKAMLEKENNLELNAVNEHLKLMEKNNKKDTDEYRRTLQTKEALQQEFNAKNLANENALAENLAELKQKNVDSWNDMFSDLILGTKTEQDILKDQWRDFVNFIIAQTFRIEAESNIFKMVFGFGTGSSDNDNALASAGGSLFSAAGGWDEVPHDGAKAVLHKKEMVLSAPYANVIRDIANGNITPYANNNNTVASTGDTNVYVTISPNFQSFDPATGQEMFKQQLPMIENHIVNSMQNKSGFRNVIKNIK